MDAVFIQKKGLLWGLDISREKAQLFSAYYNLIQKENKKYNLTRIEKAEEILEEHFFDPLRGYLNGISRTGTELMDIGSGAGFPGIPLKIFNSGLKLILVEKTRKKALFLKKTVRELGLKNTEIWHERVEEIARSSDRENFSWVTARAMAPLPLTLEIALPLLKKEGYFWSFQGPSFQEGLTNSLKIGEDCGAELQEIVQYILPATAKKRAILIFRKIKETSSIYPRRKVLKRKNVKKE